MSRSKEEKGGSPALKSSPRPKELGTATSSSSSQSESISVSSRAVSSHSPVARHSNQEKEEERIKRHGESPRSPSRPTRSSSAHLESSKNPSGSYSAYSGFPSATSGYPHFSTAGHGLSAETAASLSGYPYNLHAHPGMGSAAAAAALAAQSSALAAQSSALKSVYGASMSPYVSYARVRTPTGATTLVPVCREPYCTTCQMTVQNSHLSSTCTAVGCTQCAHEKALQNLSLGLHSSAFPHLPPSSFQTSSLLSSPSSSLGSHLLSSSLYPPSALSAAHTGLPFVCNWVSPGNEHCGKRFTSSEELLQHLRSHTTSADPLSLAAAYERYGLATGSIPGLSHLGLPSSGSISPNSLRRNYPTSVSPLSGLMGSSRYHPYKSLISPPSGLSTPQQMPSFGPYISPYSLYGQRLGAAAAP